MKLYFSNDYYKRKVLEDEHKCNSEKTVEEALFLLINGVTQEDLSNLCVAIKVYFKKGKNPVSLSIEECYKLTQGENIDNKNIYNKDVKNIIYRLAYKCIENGIPLGSKTIMDGKINTSDWIGHSLFEGKVSGQLAQKMGLDIATAQKLGILHDYGRKVTHNFDHVIAGYEMLVDNGWETEAIGCLTHSFLSGGRCSSNEQAEEGFYVDDKGEPNWIEDTVKDDLTVFLENYKFSEYDNILNIADLMATSYEIVSPSERIADIATRRKEFDPVNRSYFLAELTNSLIEMTKELGGKIPENMEEKVKVAKGVTLEEVTGKFEKASKIFFSIYQELYRNINQTGTALPINRIEMDVIGDTQVVARLFEDKACEEQEIDFEG